MLIKEFGGEFKLIDKVIKQINLAKHPDIVTGPGDDAAVIKVDKDKNLLISTDMFVNGDHFSTAFFSPLEIGFKVAEASLSDIAAMGGKAKYIFVSISLKKNTTVSFFRSVYRGIYKSCERNNVLVLGGDITKSSKIQITATVVGFCSDKDLCLRSSAKVGDVIKVSGPLGNGSIGYTLFKRKYLGHQRVKKRYLEPECRLDLVDKIAPYANAMCDVSDGLASEVKHICYESKLGAKLYKNKFPFKDYTYAAAKALKVDIYKKIMFGGEDFELVYTVPKIFANKTPGIVVGEIIKEKRVYLVDEEKDKIEEIKEGGFDHFK